MIYTLLKRVILGGSYDVEDISNKMDLYLMYNRITMAQYEELLALMVANPPTEA